MLIRKRPFQQALIHAALELYKDEYQTEANAPTSAGKCLWNYAREKTVSQTEEAGFQRRIFSSSEQRASEIRSLKKKGNSIRKKPRK